MPSVIGWDQIAYADGIAHAVVAGMGDPLAAGHELPVGAVAEGVAHAAMTSRQPDARLHRVKHGIHLLALESSPSSSAAR